MPADTVLAEHAPTFAPLRLEPRRPHHTRALSRLDLGTVPPPTGLGDYVVTRLGAVVGLLTLTRCEDTVAVTVAVDGVRRGRGVGSNALVLAEDLVLADGATRMTATVPLRDLTAVAAVRRAGFGLVGVVRGESDALLYEKDLTQLRRAA